MEFTGHEDIEAPASVVFDRVTDFAAIERKLMRRGADVTRIDTTDPPDVGSTWEVKFRLRGKTRTVTATIEALDASNGLTVSFAGTQIQGRNVVELVPLSPARTRLSVSITAEAKTIAARLMLQSMRFGKQRVNARLATALAGFAEDVERGHRDRTG